MRLLLDTHVFLWALAGDGRLSAAGQELFLNADELYVSAASFWEIAIKERLGKLDADVAGLLTEIKRIGVRELPVSAAHAVQVRSLPDHHRDPFDRLLVAQAIAEPMHLLTADAQLAQYSSLVIQI